MLALVRVSPPIGRAEGTRRLHVLPELPAADYAGLFVRCEDRGQLDATLGWYRDVRELRPCVPLGLVCEANYSVRPLAAFPHSVAPLLSPSDLLAGAMPLPALQELRASSLHGLIVEEILQDPGSVQPGDQRRLLEAIVAHGIRGGTVARVARELQICTETVRRKLEPLGIKPGELLRRIRVRAFELRLEIGVDRQVALAAGGWSSHDARRKTARRLRCE